MQPITNLASDYVAGDKSPYAQYYAYCIIYVGGLVSGLLVASWSHILNGRRDASVRLAKAKDEFLAVIADQRSKMSTEPRRDVVYGESIPVIVSAVYRLRYVLPESHWVSLRDVLAEYESQGHANFHEFEDMKAEMFKDREFTKQKLNGFLERFERIVYDAV